MIARIRTRLRALLDRSALEAEMQDEMAEHLRRATERYLARGMSPRDAERAARLEFGNRGVLQEEARDARGGRWIESLGADIRFAFRTYRRRPLLAVTVILVLTLGIGTNTAMVSVLQAISMRPAPGVPNDDALVRVRTTAWTDRELDHREVSYPELEDLARRTDLFATVAGWARETVGLSEQDGERGATVSGLFVTPNYFSTLRIAPTLGHLAAGRDPRGPPELTIVLSHRVWRDQFGGQPDIIGKHVKVNGVIVEVVGVGPERFTNAALDGGRASVFLPISARALILGSFVPLGSRDVRLFNLFARLAPGVDLDRADAQVRQMSAAAVAALTPPVPFENANAEVLRLRGNTEELDDDVIVVVLLAGLSAIFVLLVSCTNVSALLIGAAVARRQEIAVRLSMGASRMRLVRQLVTETSMLALAGATLGIGLYWVLTHAIRNSVTVVELAPDWWTVIYTALFAIGTGLVFGLSPALHATRLALSEVLKGAATSVTSRSRLQQGFIVAQVALTQPLLVIIAFVLVETTDEVKQTRTSEIAARAIRLEFDARRVDSTSRFSAGVAVLRARLATMSGVTAVLPEPTGAVAVYPTVHPQDRTTHPDDTARELTSLQGTVPGYLAALGARIVRGRDVEWVDTATQPRSLLISEETARRYLGSADPIGRRITFVDRTGTEQKDGVVVGVFEAHASLIGGSRTQIYVASRGTPVRTLIITAGDGARIVPAVRTLAMREVPSVPIEQLATIAQTNERVRTDVLQVAGGAGVGAALALLLASIGLYGAIALAIGQRTREIAIRMAIGARAREVVAIFFARGVRLAVVGLAIGLPLSLVAIWSLLEQANEKPLDASLWLISATIAAVVLAVASLATWLPARRAALVDPMKSLRTD